MGKLFMFPGSESAEGLPPEPRAPSATDLCESCLGAVTCAIAVAKASILMAAGGGEPGSITISRCAFYVSPSEDPDPSATTSP